jgi:hypothetical protein
MISEQAGDKEVIAYVVRHMTCEVCCTPYQAENVQVALREGGQRALVATCPSCHAERVVRAYDHPPYVHLLKDISLVVPSKITQDDVDQWAAFLANFTGDMIDLIAPF